MLSGGASRWRGMARQGGEDGASVIRARSSLHFFMEEPSMTELIFPALRGRVFERRVRRRAAKCGCRISKRRDANGFMLVINQHNAIVFGFYNATLEDIAAFLDRTH
jgi:hypothetical protein